MKKIIIAIPHFYKYDPQAIYGSGLEKAESRAKVLRQTIVSLRQMFSLPHAYGHQMRDHKTGKIYIQYEPADTEHIYDIDICICTTAQDHLLEKLELPVDYYEHYIVDVNDPMYLGFSCHQVLKDHEGAYDYYCYMEDDLVIRDLFFFDKLAWFEQQFGTDCLLQPHRYMFADSEPFAKEYLDYDFDISIPDWVDLQREDDLYLETELLGRTMRFAKTKNPHSGCFFLSQKQYAKLCAQEKYPLLTDAFYGPLESAASLDITRNFTVYKSDFSQASFLEIDHIGRKPQRMSDSRYNREKFAKAGFHFT